MTDTNMRYVPTADGGRLGVRPVGNGNGAVLVELSDKTKKALASPDQSNHWYLSPEVARAIGEAYLVGTIGHKP